MSIHVSKDITVRLLVKSCEEILSRKVYTQAELGVYIFSTEFRKLFTVTLQEHEGFKIYIHALDIDPDELLAIAKYFDDNYQPNEIYLI